jgi:hypothetical protein
LALPWRRANGEASAAALESLKLVSNDCPLHVVTTARRHFEEEAIVGLHA